MSTADPDWQRLDPRMLLVHPVREVLRFLPALLALLVANTAANDGPPWHYAFVAVPIALGVLRYLTTRYRVAAGRVELRRGLLNRHVLSTPLDRVRTVDLTASPIHRLLGVTTVRIGTGTAGDADALDLDGLPVVRARALRADLLSTVASDPGAPGAGSARPVEAVPLVTFDASWLRFAPFTGSGLAVAAAALGALSQLLNTFDAWDDLESAQRAVAGSLAITLVVVVAVLAVAVVAMIGYLVTNGGFRLTRADGAWHVRRGLLTTRETTLDEDRVAGVALGEPLLLRAARGRHLTAIVTGVDRKEAGSATLVPPAPAAVAPRVAAVVLGTSAPLDAPLRDHGPAARRRRWVRALVAPAALLVLAVAATATGGPWWLPVPAALVVAGAAYVAHDRAAGLGHALVEGHVVARSGSLARSREVLAVDHVIGWTWRATWVQRRQGLTTLVATTAGGRGRVVVVDVPESDAVALAGAATPDLLVAFARR